ncbi:unnamed protein product [Ilex paraguariensis]|uniref:Ubiquitin-like domain-containing protein n=1 Tax=Ilex paraguariensis TaxID=185542 RepID=A0ABC8S847_9AQUA
MRVTVEILTGKLFYIHIGDEATAADLKREIGTQENLPQDRLILIFGDDPSHLMNENELTLVYYGIEDGSHVHLFFDPLDEGSSHHFLSSSQDPILLQASPLVGLSNQQTE